MPVTVVIRYLHDLYESHLQTERFSVSLPPWQKEANYIREINTMDNMIFHCRQRIIHRSENLYFSILWEYKQSIFLIHML